MQSKFLRLCSALVATTFLFSLSGCGGEAPAPPKKKTPPPAWTSSVLPNDTQTQMFGMAIAKDRDSAIKAALADMLSRQGTSIEVNYHSQEKVTNYSSSSVVNYDIKSEVSKIQVNNYKVIKSFRLSYKEFAVMIETDKQKFVQGLKNNLLSEQKSITKEAEALASQDSLSRYNGKKELMNKANKLMPMILMISSLDNSFDKKANVAFVSTKQTEFLDASNNLKFYVAGDTRSKVFALKIKNYLAQSGFNIVASKKNAVIVKLTTKDNINSGYVKIAVLTVDVSVFDKSQRIGGKSIILKERYNGSKPSVYKNAAIHFEQDIKSKGINELIGINLNIDAKH